MKDKTARLLGKADAAIEAAELLNREGKPDQSIGRSYYAMFYVAEALLHERGLHFSKHSGVHAALAAHFVKTGLLDTKFHRWLLAAFEARLEADYGIETTLSNEDAVELIRRAAEFLATARFHLQSPRGS